MSKLNVLTGALLVVGGLNWGTVALGEKDLVATLFGKDFGDTTGASRLVYGLVGAAAAYQVLQRTRGEATAA